MPNHKHHGKRKQPSPEEEEVNDLLIASMAVASTWCPPPTGEKCTSDSEERSNSSDDACKDADEISLHDEPESPNIKDQDASKDDGNVQTEESTRHDDSTTNNPPTVESDDESEIDLTENLANMLDEDEEPKKANTKSFGIYEGPKTEHEIDPYQCPIDELEKLNVHAKEDGLDDAMKRRLKVAGVMRSYLIEQRTVVVDSLIPASLQGVCHNVTDGPLDEGSVVAILISAGKDGTSQVTTVDEECSLQILGKVVEVFGPVQRPLYVIRLPDVPLVRRTPEECSKSEDAMSSHEKAESASVEDTDHEVEEEQKMSDETKEVDVGDNEEVRSEDKTAPNTINDNQSTEHSSEKRKLQELNEQGEDPWSPNGKLSTVLRNNPHAIVYSVVDHSTLIDKDQIIKISGRGCGEFCKSNFCSLILRL